MTSDKTHVPQKHFGSHLRSTPQMISASENGVWGNIAVRNKALRLLRESDAIDQGPVRMARVLDHIGYGYSEFTPDRNTQQIKGAISHGDHMIYINADEIDTEKHLTLAHEIGHFSLHPGENVIDFRSATQDHLSREERCKEREANVFAYELVMPYPEVIKLHKQNLSLSAMAEYFLVSEENLKKRIKFLSSQVKQGRIPAF